MTQWDLLSQIMQWFIKPCMSDVAIRAVILIIAVLIIIEIMPVPAKPLSRMARSLGRSLNAEVLERVAVLEKKSQKAEKDNVRTQMLILLSDYPENTQEIMEVAQHYFYDIGGDWYMTGMFNQWLEKYGHGKPDWFDPKK